MKAKHPDIFYDRQFVMDVLRLLANFRFKLGARRFIHGLIDNTAFTPDLCRGLPWDETLGGSQGIRTRPAPIHTEA